MQWPHLCKWILGSWGVGKGLTVKKSYVLYAVTLINKLLAIGIKPL